MRYDLEQQLSIIQRELVLTGENDKNKDCPGCLSLRTGTGSPASGTVRLLSAGPYCLCLLADLIFFKDASVPGAPDVLSALCLAQRGEILYQSRTAPLHRLNHGLLCLNISHDSGCRLFFSAGTTVRALFALIVPGYLKAVLYNRLGPEADLSVFRIRQPLRTRTGHTAAPLHELPNGSALFKAYSRDWDRHLPERLTELLIEQLDLRPLRLSPAKREDRLRIGALTAYLREHPEEKPNLDHCAEMTLMSRRKLTDLFREVTGLSVGDYRDLIRLEESKKLLDDPSLSVSDIAETLGFGSISSFSAFFKQQCGFSPSRYRRSQAQP